MRSLMRENEREREVGVGGGECKQMTSNGVSDWYEWEMLRGRDERQSCLCQ